MLVCLINCLFCEVCLFSNRISGGVLLCFRVIWLVWFLFWLESFMCLWFFGEVFFFFSRCVLVRLCNSCWMVFFEVG